MPWGTENREPLALCAFDGWNDAGSAATAAVAHLAELIGAEEILRWDPEEYFDFQLTRPLLTQDEDNRKRLRWPAVRMLHGISGTGRELVLIVGNEPTQRWPSFCTEVIDVLKEHKVGRLICIGSYLTDVAHTRPTPVLMTSSDPELRSQLDIEANDYQGPVGLLGALEMTASQAQISAINLAAAIPHYVANPPAPKATLAILETLEDLLGEHVNIGDLAEDIRAWTDGVDLLMEADPDLAEYVSQLEEAQDAMELPGDSGEELARQLERYLRHYRDGGGPRF